MKTIKYKPEWLKIKLTVNENYSKVKHLVENNDLHTICSSGKCPNISECWGKGTATLMILGDVCTRSCKFCAVKTGKPMQPDKNEPKKIANTTRILKLKHVVITSVDRDDLNDYGASHWTKTIQEVRKINENTIIEILIPDFQNREDLLKMVFDAKPDILAHNLETVNRLTPIVRNKANYQNSLNVLRLSAEHGLITKSGIMVGLGETKEEVVECMKHIRNAGATIMTIGQYLQPTPQHLPVKEYIHPVLFYEFQKIGLAMGFKQIESAPLVRSSYMAEQSFSNIILNNSQIKK